MCSLTSSTAISPYHLKHKISQHGSIKRSQSLGLKLTWVRQEGKTLSDYSDDACMHTYGYDCTGLLRCDVNEPSYCVCQLFDHDIFFFTQLMV